jgi:metal-dependent amidase/aminoacylase/carboxypeptidase family protein
MMPSQGGPTTAIPFIAEIDGMVRGRTMDAITDANQKVDRSIKAGAMAMGATVDIETLAGTFPNRQDPNLVRLARANCALVVGEDNMAPASHRAGSADLGDVSCLMPVLHPHSGGVTDVSTHSTNYHVVDHTLAAVNPAKWMALTVVDLLWDGANEATNALNAAEPGWSSEQYVAERRKLNYRVSYGGDED